MAEIINLHPERMLEAPEAKTEPARMPERRAELEKKQVSIGVEVRAEI